MTIVGKILVILVFLMCLATGAFLVIDFTTRTNWKAAYQALEKEMLVAKANREASSGTIGNLDIQARKYKDETDQLKQALVTREKDFKAIEDGMRFQIEDVTNRVNDANLNLVKSLAEKDRLKTEITDLTGTIKKREEFILALEKDVQKYRTEAVANENIAKSMQARNENLLAQNQEMTRTIARLQTSSGTGAEGVAKDPNAPNPPGSFVQGKILKIHAEDRGLVEISLGSDHGVNKNNTLEVYRLKPKAEYLGTIRITDARHHNSVGRLMRAAGSNGRQLQEGDIVASSISANK